jgi:hypothetical protein
MARYWGPGPDRVNPLRPDRLGEALVNAGLIKDLGAVGLHRLLLAASDRQSARTLTVLTRRASQSDIALDAVTTALAQAHINLTLRAETAARGKAGLVGDVSLATSLIGLFTSPAGRALVEELAEREPDNTGYRRDVAASLSRLGDLAVAVGAGPRCPGAARAVPDAGRGAGRAGAGQHRLPPGRGGLPRQAGGPRGGGGRRAAGPGAARAVPDAGLEQQRNGQRR